MSYFSLNDFREFCFSQFKQNGKWTIIKRQVKALKQLFEIKATVLIKQADRLKWYQQLTAMISFPEKDLLLTKDDMSATQEKK